MYIFKYVYRDKYFFYYTNNILFLGSQSREECEYILNLPFNPAGSYLVRFSHRKQKFILSG